MCKKDFAVLFITIGVPLIIAFVFLSVFFVEAYRYNAFQDRVKQIYEKSGYDFLRVSVCHEWKCIFEYKDSRSNIKFTIFGAEDLEKRIRAMITIASEEHLDTEKCLYFNPHIEMCQI